MELQSTTAGIQNSVNQRKRVLQGSKTCKLKSLCLWNLENCEICQKYSLYVELSNSCDWLKAYGEFFEISTCDVRTADYTIIMSRTLKVMSYHVMFDRRAWFLRVLVSTSHDSCCLSGGCLQSVKKQKHDSLGLSVSAFDDNPYLDLDYSGKKKRVQ